MTRVLLTGGSGFIAAHTLDILLERGHSVVTTVRTQEKADKIKEQYPKAGDKLSFAIVPDIAQPGAFDEAVKSDPPFEAVLHTASPFHFNVTDVQKVSKSTTKCLKALSLIITGSYRPSSHWNHRHLEVHQEECTFSKACRHHIIIRCHCTSRQRFLARPRVLGS